MGTEPFQDVYEYIKLFTPVGWKADHFKWSDTVRKMFTEGYCFNFAKALKTTFEHKYNCRIVGTGRFEVLQYPNNVWKQTSKVVKEAIYRNAFNHFIVVMEDPGHPGIKRGFDICGDYSILDSDYDDICIWCRTFDEKVDFLERLECEDHDAEQKLAEYYNKAEIEEDSSCKLFWYLTEPDIEEYTLVMKKMESRTYIDH